MNLFKKKPDDPYETAYNALPDDKKEELQKLQAAEHKKVYDAEILIGEPQENAEVFADIAVETLTKNFIDEYSKQAQIAPPPVPPAAKKDSKMKFTFEFELYKKGVLQPKKTEVSALHESEGEALSIAIAALKQSLEEEKDVSIRYTNRFTKQAVTVEEV